MDVSDLDIQIEPREVLAHLHRMGYLHVSPEHLKSFIADLKKLIKYDAKRCNCSIESLRLQAIHSLDLNDESEENENILACNPPVSNRSCNVSLNNEGRHHSLDSDHHKNVTQNMKAGYSMASSVQNSGHEDVPAGHRTLTARGCNSGSENVQADKYVHERKAIRGSVLVKKTNKERNSNKDSREEAKISFQSHSTSSIRSSSSRPRSSFIKPRPLQPPPQTRRSDPVALYHKYQSYWQQRKVPGDNHHEVLRWSVREKMLGSDPTPRPMSRAASVDKVNRPSWNYR